VPIYGTDLTTNIDNIYAYTSTDGGTSWNAAVLKPPLSSTSWVLWEYAWSPSRTGRYRIVARAYDGGGTLQGAKPAPPFPDGASGYDTIDLSVSL